MRYDLTGFEWSVTERLLPDKPRGVARIDDRRVLNGIFRVFRSGAPWRDLPGRYGAKHHLLQPLQPVGGARLAYGTGLWMRLQRLMTVMCR